MKFDVPDEVRTAITTLKKAGFEAYLVGGCVRDLVLGRVSKDWDVATNAEPKKVQELFPDSVYENDFGTVGVKTESENPALKIIEITTYRIEGKYSDKRHPDEIKFAKTIQEDLSRRDFTINAMAMDVDAPDTIIDPFGGEDDLSDQTVKTVGDPHERFREDALRLMRAARFATEFAFEIEPATRRAIVELSGELEMISKERVRDELMKMLMTTRAADGIVLLEELNLLNYVLPELREGIGMGQNKHHIFTVFEHNVKSLEYAAKQSYSLTVRLASLLHDVGKSRTKQGDGPNSTFYNHERVGAKMVLRILDRLHVAKDMIESAAHLVRYHMFYYNVGEVSDAGVRRFLRRVGPESVDDLIKVREADRIGSGVPKALPYKLRHFLFMIDKVKHDPISPKMLAINGDDLMALGGIPPGPRIGAVLAILLEEVIEDPARNNKDYLAERAQKLLQLTDEQLQLLAKTARGKAEEFEFGIEKEMKDRHRVQ